MGSNEATAKILVIDDDQMLITMTRYVLEEAGYKVITSSTASCSNLIVEGQPDLILLDVKLRGLQGDEAGKVLSEVEEVSRNSIIVFHSNLDEDTLRRMVRESGVDGYIRKTHDPDILKKKVAHWVGVARNRGRSPVDN